MNDNLDITIASSAGRFLSNDDPFWPRIELATLRARLGLAGTVSDTRLEVAARAAALLAAGEFADWRRVLRARGYRRLSDLARHEHGKALSTCYLRQVETLVLRTLSGDVQTSERPAHAWAGRLR